MNIYSTLMQYNEKQIYDKNNFFGKFYKYFPLFVGYSSKRIEIEKKPIYTFKF